MRCDGCRRRLRAPSLSSRGVQARTATGSPSSQREDNAVPEAGIGLDVVEVAERVVRDKVLQELFMESFLDEGAPRDALGFSDGMRSAVCKGWEELNKTCEAARTSAGRAMRLQQAVISIERLMSEAEAAELEMVETVVAHPGHFMRHGFGDYKAAKWQKVWCKALLVHRMSEDA